MQQIMQIMWEMDKMEIGTKIEIMANREMLKTMKINNLIYCIIIKMKKMKSSNSTIIIWNDKAINLGHK